MSHYLKSSAPLALVFLVALSVGYALPRSRDGDMMDAVAAVQRRSPWFLVSQPHPPANWVRRGAIYLCRTPRTAIEMDALSKYPWRPDPRWSGVVCFKGTVDPLRYYDGWLSEGGDHCLNYGVFAVFGDPEAVEEMQAILAAEGFQPVAR
jgi:hypothetical protein